MLENCDITSVYVNGNAQTFIIDFMAVISCKADAFQIAQGNAFETTARADWSESMLPGKYGQLLGVQKAQQNKRSGTYNKSTDAPGSVLSAITTTSSAHFAQRVFDLVNITNNFPVIISFAADFTGAPRPLAATLRARPSSPL